VLGAAAKKARPSVLAASEFETLLARERDLADRGTRLFCLLVLHERDGNGHGLLQLGMNVRRRLRSTDLVGRLKQDQLGVLLSDTELAGAQIVSGWIDELASQLDVRLDATIYVYPSVQDALAHGREDDDSDDDGHSTGIANHRRFEREDHDGEAAMLRSSSVARAVLAPAQNGSAHDGHAAHTGNHWPTADLWTELSEPLPLWKRAIDVTCSALALIALAPLFLLVALAIKLDSPGPVIFRQKRAGPGARPFAFYKFRSMFVDAEKRRAELTARNEQSGPVFKIHDDPRITRVGRVLRRWSIDELPQLWNILKGDISLVGPRSPTFDEVAQYERWQRRRLNVTGGVTCIWQVSGRSQIGFRDWMRMDMRYIRSRGLWLDLCLLARTLPAVLSCRGAY
jgi:lipopolysaccharide/colanic/teichoic acid biosynthesis glycosyltransferase